MYELAFFQRMLHVIHPMSLGSQPVQLDTGTCFETFDKLISSGSQANVCCRTATFSVTY